MKTILSSKKLLVFLIVIGTTNLHKCIVFLLFFTECAIIINKVVMRWNTPWQ